MSSLLEEICNNKKEEIYSRYSLRIMNLNTVKKFQKELIELKEYLPCLIRTLLDDYFPKMREYGVFDEISDYMTQNRINKYSAEEQVNELLSWIDNHENFKEILNVNELNELTNKISCLEKDFEKFDKIN